MKLKDILKKVGAGIFRDAVPGGGMILDALGVRADKATLTGHDLARDLPPEMLEKEFDVQLETIKQQGETVRAMLAADAKSTHTTRPYIAKQAFHVVAIVVLGLFFLWGRAVWTDNHEMLKVLSESEAAILALIGPFVMLLYAYFGILKTEHKNRLDSAQGSTSAGGILGTIATIFKKGKS